MKAAAVAEQALDHGGSQDVFPRPLRHGASLLQDEHAGEPRGDLVNVMRHENHAQVRVRGEQPGKRFKELLPRPRIEPMARLIQEEEVRAGGQRPRNEDPLPLPRGKAEETAACELLHPQLLKHLKSHLLFVSGDLVVDNETAFSPRQDHFQRSHEERDVCSKVAMDPPHPPAKKVQIRPSQKLPKDEHPPAGGKAEPGQEPQERRLAASVAAQDDPLFPARGSPRDVLEDWSSIDVEAHAIQFQGPIAVAALHLFPQDPGLFPGASCLLYYRSMASVTIRFYEELNAFLPAEKRKHPFDVDIPPGCTVKALIEDLGVPHTEVDLVLANGESVDFSHRPGDGERISVYPKFESWDIGTLSRVRPMPLRETKFALDVHLGRLARLLRMFGFDCLYRPPLEDEELVRLARLEKRIVLTRDRGLLKRRNVTHGYLVRSLAPHEQLGEVVRRFDLAGLTRMGSRCVECNVPLERALREDVGDRLPPAVAREYADFSTCPVCRRVFWRGSHWKKMTELAASLGLRI
jgi:uncharacterized protein with PIN domain